MTRNLLPRNLLPLLGALTLASFGPCLPMVSAQVTGQIQPRQPQAQSSALVGNWSANERFGQPGGLLITSSFTAAGVFQQTVTSVVRGLTISYMLTGVYQFNTANGTLSYEWKDFSPKQTCVGGACTPAQPPAQMGVMNTCTIKFLSANQLVATAGGASTTFVRTNNAGYPTP